MTPTIVCQILLGSLLVVVGMMASALADRIRGRHHPLPVAQTLPRERAPRHPRPFATGSVIPSQNPVTRPTPAVVVAEPIPLVNKKKNADDAMADDVMSAMVVLGYHKRIAQDAVRACVGDERATIETWTKAALRRCNMRASS